MIRTRPAALASALFALVTSYSGRPLAAGQTPAPGLPPDTRPDALGTIHGKALTLTDAPLSSSVIRLRDARIGRIAGTVTSDMTGLFRFDSIAPGSYVIEVTGTDSAAIATSQILSINAGEIISPSVKLPLGDSLLANAPLQPAVGVAGQRVVAAAGATGLLTNSPQDICVSGPCR